MIDTIETPCPFCGSPTMPAPLRRGVFVYVECPSCGHKPMAKFCDELQDNSEIITRVTYVRNRTGKNMQGTTIRLPEDLMQLKHERGDQWVRDAMTFANEHPDEFRGFVTCKSGIVV